eukprot:COSAG02_NODE_8757_length_2454_cov_1.956263_2_plen_441_part_00
MEMEHHQTELQMDARMEANVTFGRPVRPTEDHEGHHAATHLEAAHWVKEFETTGFLPRMAPNQQQEEEEQEQQQDHHEQQHTENKQKRQHDRRNQPTKTNKRTNMKHIGKSNLGQQDKELFAVVEAATQTSRLAHAFSYWSAHAATKTEPPTTAPSTRADVDDNDTDGNVPMPAASSWAALAAGRVAQHPAQRKSAASPVTARPASSWAAIATGSDTQQHGHRPRSMIPPKSDEANTATSEHLRREDVMKEGEREKDHTSKRDREEEGEVWVAVAKARPKPQTHLRQHQQVVDAVSAPTPEELKSIQLAVSKLWELDTSRRLIPGKHYTLDLQRSTRLDDARDRACRPVRSSVACCSVHPSVHPSTHRSIGPCGSQSVLLVAGTCQLQCDIHIADNYWLNDFAATIYRSFSRMSMRAFWNDGMLLPSSPFLGNKVAWTLI